MSIDVGTTGSFLSDVLFFGFYGLAFSLTLILVGEMLIRRKKVRMDMAVKKNGPNDRLMLTFGLGVVLSWVIIASTASYFSIVEERDITDSQLTVIGLLGGPALLMITTVLDLFKGKESAKINILPDQLASDVASTDAEKDHIRALEMARITHELEMEKMQKSHELKMDEFVTTSNGNKSGGKK
tara:strand:+ start:6889 stop:7440 length:552 start_codon:yes stop_codon:yes gene_type:complete